MAEFFFCVFMDRDEVEVHKHAKKERGQYPAILTEQAWSIYKLEIEMVQRRAARFVLGRYNNTSSVGDMLYELGWTSLQTRRQTLRLCMMYKIHKGLIAMDAQEFMTPLQRRSRHVNSNAYKIPRSKTDYHMYSFFPRTIREWNSLANETVNAPNLTAFKKSLPSDQGQTKRC